MLVRSVMVTIAEPASVSISESETVHQNSRVVSSTPQPVTWKDVRSRAVRFSTLVGVVPAMVPVVWPLIGIGVPPICVQE